MQERILYFDSTKVSSVINFCMYLCIGEKKNKRLVELTDAPQRKCNAYIINTDYSSKLVLDSWKIEIQLMKLVLGTLMRHYAPLQLSTHHICSVTTIIFE